MPSVNASFSRDSNSVPITTDGITITNTKVLSGNNTTAFVPVFRITGTVEIRGLWAVASTTIGVNHTAAYFRLNDQTAQVAITLATGVTLSGLKTGTIVAKKGLNTAALTLLDNAAGRVSEPTTLETTVFSPFLAVKKTAATTDIEYSYATTDAPTTGSLTFYARFIPVSDDGTLTLI